ncbi:hypothetical protein JYU34_005850 [Plutella xylostella]|uniref:Uncharacterized protein n=1 Tax=Plutella xylostella TaxID=51655 RepID=A0ABQ7QUA5_PLUXY|nr:hypothetical protein JYU34_005850 [Plutella xylostella]
MHCLEREACIGVICAVVCKDVKARSQRLAARPRRKLDSLRRHGRPLPHSPLHLAGTLDARRSPINEKQPRSRRERSGVLGTGTLQQQRCKQSAWVRDQLTAAAAAVTRGARAAGAWCVLRQRAGASDCRRRRRRRRRREPRRAASTTEIITRREMDRFR